ncbi:uncharacterized protein LOC124302451 isoform X1 [Neodiprion virginianus]|uniref:uncharacterized protein LOC124302451 isoform X1 n=1 Tax=Neodiprion virginianus TaxID=2961670 RepID=UPI001EE71C65|nr:uncharacterized protein LOC124302451 isoform X1 [Neodiprion virginianus]XP_046614605.1 uncharacterized protein LOC124302451 isoform X1 [Neodiprion virginianus]
MVVGEASIHNIMGGMESTGGVRLHNHKRKLKQRFDIIKKLGQGTYGKVQLGINKETGQEVAIKTIKKCKIETEADLIRIRREIQIMSSVQHPNIIHIYEVFENREKMVLVMEYAAGGELYDYLSERKVLSEHEARRIFRQISTAVYYCHKHKICHRDLKLENILLDQIGNAKIADFGLSNVFDEQRLLSTFCGSPLYASPEIVKGTPYHGPEVDCWSLGVLLYTLVYGAMPFDGSNFKRLVKQISQSDYFEPKKPSPASPLIKDMLTVCPTRRADVEKICTHWWVNEGYEQNCLDIAEDLAAQTPVRLDLLLSLVPQSASADKLVVGDQQATGDATGNMSTETLVPTRCHSVGSLMELDQNNSDRRIREMVDEEPRSATTGDAKRKLETTPSMDETAAAGVKRKERSRRKERTEEREPRQYRSGTRHYSAPIPNPIEEAMEVDPSALVTVPTSKTVDINHLEGVAACLELIEESKEKALSHEQSKTPVVPTQEAEETIGKKLPDEKVELKVQTAVKQDVDSETVDIHEEETDAKSIEKTVQSSPDDKPVVTSNETNEKLSQDSQIENTKSEVLTKGITAATEAENNDVVLKSEESSSEAVVKSEEVSKDEKKPVKKLKEKSLSLDSDVVNDTSEVPARPVERRRSKIFETAEKFNQLAATTESDKPKKIFIPGVNVGGAKRAFERKASLSSITPPQTTKHSASKVIIEVPAVARDDKIPEKISNTPSTENNNNKADKCLQSKLDEEKKRAVDIITGAIGKPPVMKKTNGSPPTSPQNHSANKLGLKVQVGPNDLRNATVSVSTPVETKFPFESKPVLQAEAVPGAVESSNMSGSVPDEPKKSSKMEITLKSATLPRPRKTSKAEITLAGVKSADNTAFKSEVEAKIDAFHPQKLRTQRSEVAFPVAAAVPQANRSSSLEPENRMKNIPKERIIPIQVESGRQLPQQGPSTPPSKPPMPQRSMSQRSGSLSRQSTADSDTDSALGSTTGPEPIRKSPREYIIPIAVEGGGYVTPRSGSLEPESKASTPTSTSAPRSRFGRPRRMSSLLSDASEDESPFSTLHRDNDDILQRHMHRLRSSRPSRKAPEHADSLSSGEDDDDDGFELLTAENLFSTLLSRVRSLTQRLNVDDNRSTGFPSSRLLGRLGSNSPQGFWGVHEPLSSYQSYTETRTVITRLSESQFRRSLSRDTDRFGRKEPSNPGTPNSPGPRNTPSRESIFEMGSNTLPRDKNQHENTDAEVSQIRKQAQETLEQNFTPSLARRLSRHFIEQTRQSLPRSPSIPREKNYQSPTQKMMNLLEGSDIESQNPSSTTSDQTEYRGKSAERNIKRSNSLLVSRDLADKLDYRSPRRSVSLFEDDDKSLPPLPRHVMTLGRKYRDSGKPNNGAIRRENFQNFKNDKIQEETLDESCKTPNIKVDSVVNGYEIGQTLEGNSMSVSSSINNFVDTASSMSAKSSETSPNASTSNLMDYNYSYKSDASKDFENRLLAAENLIKESKLKNLGPSSLDINLNSSYRDMDKCNKESLGSISETNSADKRRSYIPSLRLRSGSLTRDPTENKTRRSSFTGSQDALGARAPTPERSILSKFFKPDRNKDNDTRGKHQKAGGQRRISRFLRPDFFDTPREESQYVKEKEAQKAAENERRKSRFIKKKSESKESKADKSSEAKPPKELKNEANSITKEQSEISSKDDRSDRDISSISEDTRPRFEKQSTKHSFLHSLEKKLEKFRSSEDASKSVVNNGNLIEQKIRSLRESSAPPKECPCTESSLIKRAVSVEDLPLYSANLNPSKGKVSSVLGLFKNTDTKPTSNGQRPQSMIFSKLRKNPYKGSHSDSTTDADLTASSKIPTKVSKADLISSKKKSEETKSISKMKPNNKTSPPKESPRDTHKSDRPSRSVKSFSPEKINKELKKSNPEKSVDKKNDSTDKAKTLKTKSPDNLADNRSEQLERVGDINQAAGEIFPVEQSKAIPSDKTMDNLELEGRKNDKVRKIGTTSSLVKNDSVKGIDKVDDGEKKAKKTVKAKESGGKESGSVDGTKKKRIVKVIKKVVKKSPNSSESKSEAKEKPRKLLSKKSTLSSGEVNSDTQISNGIDNSRKDDPKLENNTSKPDPLKESKAPASNNDKNNEAFTENNTPEMSNKLNENSINGVESKTNNSLLNSIKVMEKNQSNNIQDVSQAKSTESRSNRNSLKLDLSKIPQHTFRSPQILKKDSVQTELPKTSSSVETHLPKLSHGKAQSTSPEDAKKLIQNLSKITHHANITGNKIVIDKPLCAKDMEKLQSDADECNIESRENSTSQSSHDISKSFNCPKLSHDQNKTNDINFTTAEVLQPLPDTVLNTTRVTCHQENEISNAKNTNGCSQEIGISKKNFELDLPVLNPNPIPPPKESPIEHPEEMFSPTDDTESFDSWSICSADMNQSRSELQSPTSPARSPSFRADQTESVGDRIRRRSFYSRFNDRKRKTSLNAPPPGVSLPVSTTLPRKFSFNRPRENDHDKLNSYVSPTKRYQEKSYNMYNNEIQPFRRSPIDRDRYSDVGTASVYTNDLRSPKEQYGSSLSSSYDPLRKYTRSPTLSDSSSIRRKCYSTDYGTDNNEATSYRSPLSSSLLNDNSLESYSNRNFNTLPRKYGSTVSSSEPKTAEYYEELLAPNNSNYLTSRKTPTSADSLSTRENGYHNGNLESPQFKAEKWKTTGTDDKMAELNLTETNNGRLGDQISDKSQSVNESKDLSSTMSEPQPSTSTNRE